MFVAGSLIYALCMVVSLAWWWLPSKHQTFLAALESAGGPARAFWIFVAVSILLAGRVLAIDLLEQLPTRKMQMLYGFVGGFGYLVAVLFLPIWLRQQTDYDQTIERVHAWSSLWVWPLGSLLVMKCLAAVAVIGDARRRELYTVGEAMRVVGLCLAVMILGVLAVRQILPLRFVSRTTLVIGMILSVPTVRLLAWPRVVSMRRHR